MKLYGYYRSSTSYRLRIALNIKDVGYEQIPVNLLEGQNRQEPYQQINPFGTVPMLESEGIARVQSMAIIEWLDERYPDNPLLPGDSDKRYVARELAYAIATELHAPLNLSVLKYLRIQFDQDSAAVEQWYHHWLAHTLAPLEQRLEQLQTEDLLYQAPGLFELVLIPQLYNARRFNFDLSDFSRIRQIESYCLALPSFIAAHPDNQPDSPTKENI